MKAMDNPRAPHNQKFNITGKKSNKKGWWLKYDYRGSK